MRMILILIVLAVPAGVVLGSAVYGETLGAARGRLVVASFYPLALAARELSPPGTTVADLTPPGVEPHDLELTPEAVRRLEQAELVLLLGSGFQPQIEQAAGSGPRVLRLLAAPGDPHVWLDPVEYALIAARIGDALGRPSGAFRRRLAALDADYRRGLASCRRRELLTSHAAFGRLAARYGLRQIALTGLEPEAEPAAHDLQRVVAEIRRTGATTVFVEPLVSPRPAKTIAREAGVRTAVLDPIESGRGDDYFRLMRENLRALRQALGCR